MNTIGAENLEIYFLNRFSKFQKILAKDIYGVYMKDSPSSYTYM